MAKTYAQIVSEISSLITTNGHGAITGAIMQSVLLDMSAAGIPQNPTTGQVLVALSQLVSGGALQLQQAIPADPGAALTQSYASPYFNPAGPLAAQITTQFPTITIAALVTAALAVVI